MSGKLWVQAQVMHTKCPYWVRAPFPGGGVNLLSVHCTVSHVRQDEGIKGTARRDI
jgi:hypothetical protein